MKTLVIQLARLGDICQTLPVLHALKRADPTGEIHFATRSKFSEAASFAATVDRQWVLQTKDILSPVIRDRPDIDQSMMRLGRFIADLRAENFDRVINLTFSPFSSYLTKEIAGPSCDVRGYTRFDDGYLSIPDDGSAYFYAQGGVGRPNRVHVTDLFAYVAGVELSVEDWSISERAPVDTPALAAIGDNAVLVHIGASDPGKTFEWSKWLQVVRGLLESHDGTVVLIGAPSERDTAEKIASVSGTVTPLNLVGQTNLTELVEIIRSARLLIGGDSGPVQIASLTGTPVLNISLPSVNLWETGPRSAGSRIVAIESQDAIASDVIVREAMNMLNDEGVGLPLIRVTGPLFPYLETVPSASFDWEMARALYMEEAFPPPTSELFVQGMERLFEVNRLAREQIESLRRNRANTTASAILDQVDEIMEQIMRMVPEIGTVIRWFRTERLRIGPLPVDRLIEATDAVHSRLESILSLYCRRVNPVDLEGEDDHDNVVLG